jgi:hypothetical protein
LGWCAQLITRIEDLGFNEAMKADAWQHRSDGRWQLWGRAVDLPPHDGPHDDASLAVGKDKALRCALGQSHAQSRPCHYPDRAVSRTTTEAQRQLGRYPASSSRKGSAYKGEFQSLCLVPDKRDDDVVRSRDRRGGRSDNGPISR